jgi:hypothetical protein
MRRRGTGRQADGPLDLGAESGEGVIDRGGDLLFGRLQSRFEARDPGLCHAAELSELLLSSLVKVGRGRARRCRGCLRRRPVELRLARGVLQRGKGVVRRLARAGRPLVDCGQSMLGAGCDVGDVGNEIVEPSESLDGLPVGLLGLLLGTHPGNPSPGFTQTARSGRTP